MNWLGLGLLVYVVGFTLFWAGAKLHAERYPTLDKRDWVWFKWRVIILWPLFPVLLWWERWMCRLMIERATRQLRKMGLTKTADTLEAKYMADLRQH